MAKTILCIGDCHFPYVHGGALKFALKIARELKPSVIIQIGDLLDLISFSRFPRSLNNHTPKQELELGLAAATKMWAELRAASPKARCYQMLGNHDERLTKAVLVSLPEAESIVSLKQLYAFKGVTTSAAERDELIIDDIVFMHGFRSKLGDHSRHNCRKTVCGHSHVGGVVYQKLGDKTIWELNCGYVADPSTHALSYTRQRRISNWTLGVGLIDERGPRFIPYDP